MNQPVLRKEPDCLLAGKTQSAAAPLTTRAVEARASLGSLKAQHGWPSQLKATHLDPPRGVLGEAGKGTEPAQGLQWATGRAGHKPDLFKPSPPTQGVSKPSEDGSGPGHILSGSEAPSLGGEQEAAEQWLEVGKGVVWSQTGFDSNPAPALGYLICSRTSLSLSGPSVKWG